MKTLFWGSLIFLGGFLTHLAIWKIRLPKRQTKTFLMIFFAFSALSLIYLKLSASETVLLGVSAPADIYEYSHICIFIISLVLAYMITYSAVEADSPSLVMVKKIADAGNTGLDKNEFLASMNDETLIKPRINDLLTDKMAFIENGRYRLTPKGISMAKLFELYRNILARGKGA